jgi:hypothetical protein
MGRAFEEALYLTACGGIGMASLSLAVEASGLSGGVLMAARAAGGNWVSLTVHGAALVIGCLLGFAAYAVWTATRLARLRTHPEAGAGSPMGRPKALVLLLGASFFVAQATIGLQEAASCLHWITRGFPCLN